MNKRTPSSAIHPPSRPVRARKKPRLRCKSCFGSGRIDDENGSPMRRCDDCAGNGYYYAKLTLHAPGRKGKEL